MAVDGTSLRSRAVVLVVEDNERVRQAEAELLGSCGCAVLTAIDAEEGLRHLSRSRIDLMLTDIRLPGPMNGIALARAVKQSWPDVKVMIIGMDADKLPAEEMRRIADDGLVKPFRFDELEERVTKLIGRAAVGE